jgi:hypothetical protein
MSVSKPRNIAFLGATGGCTLAALTHTLLHLSSSSSTNAQAQARHQHQQYRCIALARTPSKLRNLLLAQDGITPEILSSLLTIVEGDATDREAVKRMLTATSTSTSTSDDVRAGARSECNDADAEVDGVDSGGDDAVQLVDTVISGLGGTPKLQWWSIQQPVTLDNPTICQDAARTLVAALQELLYDAAGEGGRWSEREAQEKKKTNEKPLLAFISTTGIGRGPEDVPFWLRWLYHYVLRVPHEDKRIMESVFLRGSGSGSAGGGGDDADREMVFRGVVGVRPSLLTGTGDVRDGLGMAAVRVGREKEPAVGYSIKRADVGEWVFREVVERGAEGWEGEMVTLTC